MIRRLKFINHTIFMLSVLMLSPSCDNGNGPVVLQYPLVAGNTWSYHAVDSMYNFRPDSAGFTFTDTAFHWITTSRVSGKRVLRDAMETWEVASSGIGRTYYILRNDSLLRHAYFSYSDGNTVFPKQSNEYQFLFNGKKVLFSHETSLMFQGDFFASTQQGDSITIEEQPVTVLKFPLKTGLEWIMIQNHVSRIKIGKRVVGVELIHAMGQEFSVWKVQSQWDINRDGAWDTNLVGYDYIGAQGLVKRVYVFKDLRLASPQHPEGYGSVDWTTEIELTSLSIQ